MEAIDSELRRTESARLVLERLALRPGGSFNCPYLPDRQTRNLAFQTRQVPRGLYHGLMDLNFRRSGMMLYRPACENCNQCRAVRVPATRFRPNHSQRRCLTRNHDLTVGITPPRPTREKHELYVRYLHERHNGQMDDSWDSFCDFLCRSPVDTLECVFRRAGRLVAVGVIDVDGDALSLVYCYFDPAAPDSPGTYNVLWSIDYARRLGISWVYLGYTIADAANMRYKLRFRPHEVLEADGRWIACD